MRRGFHTLLSLFALSVPASAFAHSFDERYDLPAPLGWFIAGAAATVALSLAVAAIFARAAPTTAKAHAHPWPASIGLIAWPLRLLSLALFVLAIAAAAWGTGDPLMNLAPTLI